MYSNPWLYKDEPFTSDMIEHYVGFVYLIEGNGKKYIGKKLFTCSKTKQVKKKKKRIRVESDWKEYYGSNLELLKDKEALGEAAFKRTILQLCESKGEMSYMEAKYQFQYDAIISDQYYNTWISVRVRKDHLTKVLSRVKLS